MKNPKPPLAEIKSIALILGLAGLVLVSGFISSKTLLTNTSTVDPRPKVNANSNESAVNASPNGTGANANSGEPGFTSSETGVRSGSPDVTVWVNTNSGIYHCPNTRWYGNTKNGEYMTQKEAQAQGYRPAHGSVCG